MPKSIKGNAGRKPPEPSADHAPLDDWCRRLVPDLQPIAKRLDESIRKTIPGLHYAVKWKRPYYGLPDLGWIIEIAAYDVCSGRHPCARGIQNDPAPQALTYGTYSG